MEEKQKRLLRKLRGELGQTVLDALEDPSVIEIMLNSDGSLWIERHGQGMQRVGTMSAPNAESLMGTIADALHTVVTRENPILEGELPLDGSRFEGLLPPIVGHPTFTIRKKASVVFTLGQYVEQGIMTPEQQTAIEAAILRRANILVVGGTGSGKTTLTNAIIDGISTACPDDRLVIIEDTAEIQCKAENSVILRASVDVDMLRLLRATMRLRPDRILVGEVRGGEALALLKAWNTGHPGGVATIHANGAHAGLIRLEQLIAEATAAANMAPLIAEAVDLVIAIEKTKGGRRIKEIIEVSGISERGTYQTQPVETKSVNTGIQKEKANAVA
ncbi:P-type conjugative transfer ATPase TrbB [Geoalkalibacter halelectricus]|uniref:P-type conjugative transfer ATPase TrbB n=1 Tax=Geoalkalibacter halelectricus TaxID=2847045 RepID=A0ABY5ZJQ8_9BACT|nr:P-type conjugative transfer ATPase TrbB [Geoalkalibacter halelectricus]UWZ79363.1 P-type conjugative transfer ATPase TrbB [Geoalkalibacter halelectricus]